jgi:hypothetical protein
MLVSPRYHINTAARQLVSELQLVMRSQDGQLPHWEDHQGHVHFHSRMVAQRESTCPLHDLEVILELTDLSGHVVPISVWSDEETREHREALKDEDREALMPWTEWS